LRRRMKGCSQGLPRRQREVCLRERIDRRDFGRIEGKV
jgi:hypothetical protein